MCVPFIHISGLFCTYRKSYYYEVTFFPLKQYTIQICLKITADRQAWDCDWIVTQYVSLHRECLRHTCVYYNMEKRRKKLNQFRYLIYPL